MRGAPLLLALLLCLPALAAPATTQTRTVERLVAMPTPLGPVTALDDGHAWEVDVPADAQVFVKAEGQPGSLFYLRWGRPDAPDRPALAPSQEGGATLSPGTWRVTVDPAGGAAVRILVTFTGHYGDLDGGSPAPFTLRDVKGGNPCVLPGVCLA